jgi:hypothetical protein
MRASNREVRPIEEFGIVSYDDVVSLVIFMNPLINQNKIETISTGISFVYEYK